MRSCGVHKAGYRGSVVTGTVWVAENAKAVRGGLGKIASCRISLIGIMFDLDLGGCEPVVMVRSLTLI